MSRVRTPIKSAWLGLVLRRGKQLAQFRRISRRVSGLDVSVGGITVGRVSLFIILCEGPLLPGGPFPVNREALLYRRPTNAAASRRLRR